MGIQSNIRDALLPQPPSFKKKKEYTILETLGRGGFGKVVKAHWKGGEGEGKDVALKIIPKKLVKHDLSLVTDEINVLKSLDHPNIVHVWDHFESRDKYYITFELAIGGELFDRITQRGRFTEKDAVECIRQVLEATVYLHSKEIVHRDLKPENVLYKTQSHHSPIVIADFGIAKHLEYDLPETTTISPSSTISITNNSLSQKQKDSEGKQDGDEGEKGEEEPREGGVDSFAGSFGYTAPEVLLGLRHGLKVDCWSIGVIAYTLLCGYSPFRSDDKAALVEETKRGKIVFHERYWRKVSETAKDFIRGMLVVDPKLRMSAREALDHPWMTNGKATTHDLSTTTNLQSNPFNARAKFHAAVHAVNASNRIQRLARSRSGSLDTLTSSIMSASSPINGSPDKLGQGSRKSSLNAFTTPPSGDKESDDSGYVTAEDESEEHAGLRRDTLPDSGARRDGVPDDVEKKDEGGSASTPPETASGMRGLMGRMRL